MRKLNAGFTLVEVLVALFVFSILAMMMANGLHRLLSVQGKINQQAENLHDLQMAVVYLAHDFSLAIDRPITLAHGQEAPSFVGRPHELQCTCLNASGVNMTQQRVEYHITDHVLTRWVWPTLDQAENARPSKRILLDKINEARFEYLDKRGKYHQGWPLQSDITQALPKAVRITLQLSGEGRFVQTFRLMAENPIAEVSHAE